LDRVAELVPAAGDVAFVAVLETLDADFLVLVLE
jgi:hypothetical protein